MSGAPKTLYERKKRYVGIWGGHPRGSMKEATHDMCTYTYWQERLLTFVRLLSKTDTTTYVEECAEGRGR